ncbi:MAG: c-type cytochrome [Verrucomicrobiales bacterium]|nr:c-type cytochrome [Verrucomicrobiales bacterium]
METSRPALTICAVLFISSLTFAEPAQNGKNIVPEGRIPAGKTLFVEKGCYQCHSAGDISLPKAALDQKLIIKLGTRRHAGWSQDDFAKAIMNANHTVNPDYEKAMMILGDHFKAVNSPMPGFNDILTLSDLIHLTTFLHSLK